MGEGSVEGELLSSVQANQTQGGVKAGYESHSLMEGQDLEPLESFCLKENKLNMISVKVSMNVEII